ncbi:regulator of nonsense transcripts 3B, putative [Plasmodium gallinaceum]|uniref:Regulator of nonsense transcripts 3B, putative n=1 Tax=Plasmodium gallinaceum TaxID=5849 RepID=A0A1J1GRF6_PLAGA|nr:regulator of nonsense transcripts 3B, putative [Plasmodium gallinaceum]CRG95002.1 regulator of nonsense transcripts 3B, putative [Plasmodium gallinaceum]
MYSSKRPYKILQKGKINDDNKKDTNEKKKEDIVCEDSKKYISERKKKEELKYYGKSYRKYNNKNYEENERRKKSSRNYNSGSNYYEKYSKIYTNCNDEKLNNQTSLKKKNDVLVSLLTQAKNDVNKKKIVVRHLPPTLSENHFFDSFSNNLKDELDYYYFVNGKIGKDSSSDIIHSRIYLSFKDDLKTEEFIKSQHGKFFYDINGVRYKAIVSLAPNQTLIQKNKHDGRNNTLESDEYFLKCCEEMNNPIQPLRKDIDYYELINVVNENGAILSPIVVELRDKLKKKK